MKYEITKGSEKDFEGSNDGVMRIYRSDSGSFLYADIDTFDARWELIAERRPITEPVWDGEGLPPVGVECEGLFPRHHGNSFEWQDCLVLYAFEHECAVKSKVTSTLHYCDQFRPARSPEDVARDEAIDAIFSILSVNILDGSDSNAGKVFDAIAAGKIPGVKLE